MSVRRTAEQRKAAIHQTTNNLQNQNSKRKNYYLEHIQWFLMERSQIINAFHHLSIKKILDYIPIANVIVYE